MAKNEEKKEAEKMARLTAISMGINMAVGELLEKEKVSGYEATLIAQALFSSTIINNFKPGNRDELAKLLDKMKDTILEAYDEKHSKKQPQEAAK